jgi:hypothetical protein
VGNSGTLAISKAAESLISYSSDINARSEVFFENTYVASSEATIGTAINKGPEGLGTTSIGDTVRRISLAADYKAFPSIGESVRITA